MTMQRLRLGAEGPSVSRLTYGVWRMNDNGKCDSNYVRTMIDTCLELGITTFDHADLYGDYTCEETFGAALRESPKLRDEIELISKCGIKLVSGNRPNHRIKHYDTSRDHIIASVEESLRTLHTDRLDVLLIHRPDPMMDAADTARGLEDVVKAGKVLHVGVSNFQPNQVRMLQSKLSIPLVTNQVELSVLRPNPLLDGTLDQCQELNMTPMAWSPLGGGALFQTEESRVQRVQKALQRVGESIGGQSISEVALAWLLSHPAKVVPVLGTGKVERIKEAANAVNLTLDRQHWFDVWSAIIGGEVP